MWWSTILTITGCLYFNFLSFLFHWKKLFALYSWLSLNTAALKFAVCVPWEDLQFQNNKKRFRTKGRTSPNFLWKGSLDGEQWMRSVALFEWMTGCLRPQVFVPMPFWMWGVFFPFPFWFIVHQQSLVSVGVFDLEDAWRRNPSAVTELVSMLCSRVQCVMKVTCPWSHGSSVLCSHRQKTSGLQCVCYGLRQSQYQHLYPYKGI